MTSNTFSVILPSNSNPLIFPQNNSSQFSVEFTNPIVLNGNYEVALTEITYFNDISVLKNNCIEIYKLNFKDKIFSFSQSNEFKEWKFNEIVLPQSFEINVVGNILQYHPSNKLVGLIPDKDSNREAIAAGLHDLLKPVEDILKITLDKQNKPMIVPSQQEWVLGRKIVVLFNREFAHALGYKQPLYYSRYIQSGKRFVSCPVIKPKVTVIPLYALKSRKIIFKRPTETVNNTEELMKRIKSALSEDLIKVQISSDKTSKLTFEKMTPLNGKDACVIEFDHGFLSALKYDQPPLLCNKNDKFCATLILKNLQKVFIQKQEWSILVYSNKVDYTTLQSTTELKRRHNVNANTLKSPSTLCTKLNEISEDDDIDYYEFSYDPKIERMKVDVPYGYEIRFDSVIQSMLGFSKKKVVHAGITNGDERPILVRGIHNLYIYTNIVEYTRVGNIEAPLLRSLPLSTNQNQMINREFINRYYVPVNRNIINRIDISIRDDGGESVPFESGTTVLTFEFQSKKY